MTEKELIYIVGAHGRMTEALMLAELARVEHPEISFLALSEDDLRRKEDEKPSDWFPPAGFEALARQLEQKAQITPKPRHPEAPEDPAEPQYMRNFKAGRRKGKRTDIPSPRNQRKHGRR